MTQSRTIPRWKAWMMGARPKTLPAAVAPVFVGSALACAEGRFAFLPAVTALLAALLIQIGTNLANDYFDHLKGFDTAKRKGPTRVAQTGLIPMGQLKAGIAVVFGLAALIGLYLIVIGGWVILLIGVFSLLAALAYSGGPYPLSSHGWGDLFAFLFFGPVAVVGTHYVQALQFSSMALVAGIPIGALTTAILIVNNYRDMETDRDVGKRTLAVIIGPAATRAEYVMMIALAYSIPFVLWLTGENSIGVMLPWLSLPLALRLIRIMYRATDGDILNQTLAGTARLDLIFSLLFTIGLILP